MTTPQVKIRTHSVSRSAFTLVELMVVILIIGILAGIATPFIFGALTRAREFTIENEMLQMNAAIEQFNTKNGFYPPAIGPGLEVETAADLVPYLNRLSPGHAEVSSGGLATWWENVGQHLRQDSSLVFWLSGLSASKQYPLSGKAAYTVAGAMSLCPYNASRFANDADIVDDDGNPINISRNVFFEFKAGQLVNADPGLPPGIKVYNQPSGKGDLLAYNYRDFKSYGDGTPGSAYFNGVNATTGLPNFFNPTSFQIVAPGMDGALFNRDEGDDDALPVTDLSDATQVDPGQDDNITNFSGGRLEKSYP